MSLEKNKEHNEKINNENNEEDMYVKNSVDYSSYELSQSEGDGEDEILIDQENDLNELALLGFFNVIFKIIFFNYIFEIFFVLFITLLNVFF